MPSAIIDGITTRYEVTGSGPPLLMYSPAGFDATLDKWATQGVYAKTRPGRARDLGALRGAGQGIARSS
jgi:hypothetical protein